MSKNNPRVPIGTVAPTHGTPGTYVLVEGPDKVGKSTAVEYVDEKTTDVVETTFEPNDDRFREIVYDEDVGPQATLKAFVGDRLHHLNTNVLPDLADGKVVVSDRGVVSTIAYQSVAFEGAGLDPGYVRREALTACIAPDLIVRIDCPPEVIRDRIEAAGEPDKFEREGYLEAVIEYYEYMTEVDALSTTSDVITVDGTEDEQTVGDAVLGAIESSVE